MAKKLTRRRLLAGTAVLAGGGLVLSLVRNADDSPRLGADDDLEPNAYLQVRPGGDIILQVDKVEMGQGVMTGFVTLMAEELGARPDQITPLHAPVLSLFQTPSQLTAESNSMRSRWDTIRETGAAAREMLREAAAQRWDIPIDRVQLTGDATLVNAMTGESVTYGELASAAATLSVPRSPALTPPGQYRWIGGDVPRSDVPDKVTGRTVFGSDVRLPGMLTAIVVRPPRAGDSLLGFAADEAASMPGVHHVIEISAGVAVVADGFWQAQRAAARLRTEWQDGPLAGFTVAALQDEQRARIASNDGKRARDDGDVENALADTRDVIEAEYRTPFVAHATMETMNATVRLAPDRCEIWAPVQAPDLARQVACDLAGLRRDQVDVHTTFAGGGFGRRATMDFVVEAMQVALQVAAPVQLVWSREDDLRHDYYRSATMHQLSGGIDADGRITAWDHSLVAPEHASAILPLGLASLAPESWSRSFTDKLANFIGPLQVKLLGPYQARDGAVTLPYAAPNVRVTLHALNPLLPVGIWRSVANSYNAFVVESFIDELAHLAGADAADYRRRHLGGELRHLAVLDRLVDASGWGNAPAGRHQGMAIHACFDSVVGQVAEISLTAGRIRVHRVTCVVDCGIAINPDIVRAQLESGILFGLNAALHDEVDVLDGRVRQSNFHDYPMLRIADAPAIETHIIESSTHVGGIGEAGTPPIAPAVANAVFAATGRRLRELPLRLP